MNGPVFAPVLRIVSSIVFGIAFGLAGVILSSASLEAQSTPEMRQVLDRLATLEESNRARADEVRALTDEIRALRVELAAARGASTPVVSSAAATSKSPEVSADQGPQAQGSIDHDVSDRSIADPNIADRNVSNSNVSDQTASDRSASDQTAVDQSRIDELAQTKVESSQKLPLRITGMALFNAYMNGRNNAGVDNTIIASLTPGDATGGGTLQQTVLGLEYESPRSVFGARVTGALFADFFGGSESSLDHVFRLRTATISLDWSQTSVMVGQDKPIISPRDPSSYAQVGYAPLSGAGNLWLWQPQVRVEQRFKLGDHAGLRAQGAVFETRELGGEADGYSPYLAVAPGTAPVEHADPGVEGRFEFWRQWGETTRIEIAPGFHDNASHAAGASIPTQIFSIDWLIKPVKFLELSGFFYNGQNVATLGALPQGWVVSYAGLPHAVHSTGGWTQLRIPVTQRLAFDIYGGTQDDRKTDLLIGYILRNQGYFANAQYRIAPNVVLSLEGGQVRTLYIGPGTRLNNHYDLAVAYLF
jgi:hypothetical protein